MSVGGYDSPADAPAVAAPEPSAPTGRTRGRLLAVVATTLVIALLKWSAPATAPIAFALFFVAVAWPFEQWLERRLPRWAAFTGTVALLIALLAIFVTGLVWVADIVTQRSPQYAGRVAELATAARARLGALGLAAPENGLGLGGTLPIADLLDRTMAALALITLTLAFTILGLVDVRRVRRALGGSFDDERVDGMLRAADEITRQFVRYVGARTLVGAINGVLAGLFCLIVGLDFALVWGVMTFLLNYVPTVGSIIATIPPVLFALVQFDGFTMPLLILIGLGVLQLVLGNYVDPLVQGHYLRLSPFMVLFSIVFWSWVWGVPGALLGVPITVLIVIVTHRSERTRWIGNLLGEVVRGQGVRGQGSGVRG
ncbi:MAG: AI-2E family transporter [Longimicrobiales bacterium]